MHVAIPLSRRKLLLLVLGALAFVAIGVFLWILSDGRSTPRSLLIKGVAVLSVGFFGVCGSFGALKLFDRSPGLVLDPEGLIDNSSAVAAGRIRWDEISDIRFSTLRGQRFLTIDVVDPTRFVKRGGFLRRKVNAANVWLVGSSINISANSLRISLDELATHVSDFYRRYGRDRQ